MRVRKRNKRKTGSHLDYGIVLACALATLVAGCSCVDVMPEERSRIAQLNARGISWKRERDAGRFTPPVNMTAAVCWSLLPGAGQHFIAHKMGDYGVEKFGSYRWQDRRQLRTTGTWMLAFSWIPQVYAATLPVGCATGVVVDVNRVNNLALLEWLDRQAEDARTAE